MVWYIDREGQPVQFATENQQAPMAPQPRVGGEVIGGARHQTDTPGGVVVFTSHGQHRAYPAVTDVQVTIDGVLVLFAQQQVVADYRPPHWYGWELLRCQPERETPPVTPAADAAATAILTTAWRLVQVWRDHGLMWFGVEELMQQLATALEPPTYEQ